jgi:hypothetical protein
MLVKVFVIGMIATLPTMIVEILGKASIYSLAFGELLNGRYHRLSEEYFKRLVVLKFALITTPRSTRSWTV